MALGRARNRKDTGQESSVLDVTAAMQGSLVFSDPVNLRIRGKFQGRLQTKGVLTIADTADVEAEITGEEINIAGRVKGKIVASSVVRFYPPAVFEGELITPSLVVGEGAVIEGSCHMLTGEMMSAEELADYLKVELNSIYKWAEEGTIPARRNHSGWLFNRREIDLWLAQGKGSNN